MPAPTGSPELDKLVREFKQGYRLDRTGGGHYRVLDRNDDLVMVNGKNVTLSGTSHGGRGINNMRAQLKSAGVLKGTEQRRSVKRDRQFANMSDQNELRSQNRQKAINAFVDRLEAVLKPVGGLDAAGMGTDLGMIASWISRQGEDPITPDLTTVNAYSLLKRRWVTPRFYVIWEQIVERLEKADDIHEEWFSMVRQARGLDREVVNVKKPVEGDWPFRVELISFDALIVDHDYQRPVAWPFVRKTAASYDESLVGTIDVSERRHGAMYAILDGQLRFEASRLVGKNTIWCSVYSGLDKASEARFFLHKNKDKKAIHPYFVYRARLAAADTVALEIDSIVKQCGYEVSLTSANEKTPNAISAIAALEEAYSRADHEGYESLTPTLEVLKRSTLGLRHGQGHILIRGLSIVFQEYGHDKVDQGRMTEVLLRQSPEVLQNRARENGRHSAANAAHALARLLVADYNRGLGRGEKLEEK
jgi:hypothetical protein